MEVVLVGVVGFWAQYGAEVFAGARMDRAQKTASARVGIGLNGRGRFVRGNTGLFGASKTVRRQTESVGCA